MAQRRYGRFAASEVNFTDEEGSTIYGGSYQPTTGWVDVDRAPQMIAETKPTVSWVAVVGLAAVGWFIFGR